jgi:predicted hydrocarbon binding protein
MIGEMKTAVAALADGRDKAVDMFAKFISTRGWGDFKLSKTTGDNPKIHAVVHNIPVGEAMRGYGKPVDAYMAGCVAGIASLILGEGVLCRETKCVAMGDERCEFEASRLSDTPTLTHTPANSRNKTA